MYILHVYVKLKLLSIFKVISYILSLTYRIKVFFRFLLILYILGQIFISLLFLTLSLSYHIKVFFRFLLIFMRYFYHFVLDADISSMYALLRFSH